MFSQLLKANSLMYEESNPVGVKEVLRQFDVCENFVRMPLLPATEAFSQKIKHAIKELDLK